MIKLKFMYRVAVFVTFFFFVSITAFAQGNSDQLSEKIAVRIKDSLHLTPIQYDSVLSINRRLHMEKMEARKSFPSFDSLTRNIQRIELQRDSLYKPILTDKFDLYLQKKRNLIHNNQ
jgi:hypothetical protein